MKERAHKLHESIRKDQRNQKLNQLRRALVQSSSQQREENITINPFEYIFAKLQATNIHESNIQIHPIQYFYQYLADINHRLPILKIIQSYLFYRISTPTKELTDRVISILAQSTDLKVQEWSSLILIHIIQDGSINANLLFQQHKLIEIISSLFYRKPYNQKINKYINLIIHILVGKCQWNQQMLTLINILTELICGNQTVQVVSYIQTLYEIVNRYEQQIGSRKLYQRYICRVFHNCIIAICNHQSRSASYYFLKFVTISKPFLRQNQTIKILDTLELMRRNDFKIGNNGKYSANTIKKQVTEIIHTFLNSKSEVVLLSSYQSLLEQSINNDDIQEEMSYFGENYGFGKEQSLQIMSEQMLSQNTSMDIEQDQL